MQQIGPRSLPPSRLRFAWPVLAVALLALLRSLVFLCHGYAHFDSDQAIFGLMARHLVTGRAFPLYMYGQQYMLVVESWLAAPFFALFGSSIAMLKLPLVLLNMGIAALLAWLLIKEARLPPWVAALFSCFFALPAIATSSRLVEAAGGNIEPFFYILVLWLLRKRGFAFGIVAAVGYKNREFTAYAVFALVLLDGLKQRWRRFLPWGFWLRAGLGAWALFTLLNYLVPYATYVYGATPNLSPSPAERYLPGAVFAFGTILPELLGLGTLPPQHYGVTSALPGPLAGMPSQMQWLAAALLALGIGLALSRVKAFWRRPELEFPTYLALVGLGAVTAYIVFAYQGADTMLLRYVLLMLFLIIGLAAYLYKSMEGSVVPALVVLASAAVLANNLWQDGRFAWEYAVHPPADAYGELAAALEAHGVTRGRAGYWTAYHVSFLSQERVILDAREMTRIPWYIDTVKAAADRVEVVDGGKECPSGFSAARWQVCPVELSTEAPRASR